MDGGVTVTRQVAESLQKLRGDGQVLEAVVISPSGGEVKLVDNGAPGEDLKILTEADLIAVINYFLALTQGIGSVDDIDHLGNRRLRSVGTLAEPVPHRLVQNGAGNQRSHDHPRCGCCDTPDLDKYKAGCGSD